VVSVLLLEMMLSWYGTGKGERDERGITKNYLHTLFPPHFPRRAENLPVTKESCLTELQKGRFYFHGSDKKGRPVAYYSLACHDPKHRDLAEIMRMMTYQVVLLIKFFSSFCFLYPFYPLPRSLPLALARATSKRELLIPPSIPH